MTLKVKIWKIDGYKGNNGYDNRDDYNAHYTVALDARFSRDDVIEIFLNRYNKKYREVVFEATLIEEKTLEV